jgi:hypothetical protein
VVLVSVHTSTTNLNGVVLCDVVEVGEDPTGADVLTCRTRNHNVADASSEDPNARAVQPTPTAPGYEEHRVG